MNIHHQTVVGYVTQTVDQGGRESDQRQEVTDGKEEKGERSRRRAGNPPWEQEHRMMVKQTHHRYAGVLPAPSSSGIRVRIGWCFC
jgi:hypothetical protein